MQNDSNEFVFKRKRKRIRFGSLNLETVVQVNDGPDSRLMPEIAALAEPGASSPTFSDDPVLLPSNTDAACSESVVTVERFLRSAEANPETKPNATSLKKLRAYDRHRPTRKAPKAAKKPSESPRIARSLYRAAVLTNGDPLNTLAEDAGASLARRPLKFVPHNKFTSPSRRTRGKDHGEEVAPRTRRIGNNPSNPRAPHRARSGSKRIPLTFVPLREAEAAYAAMFPRTRPSARCTRP